MPSQPLSRGSDALERIGQMDIYLLDQLQRGRIRSGMRIFDAGAGSGRNLAYFLREGYDVRAIDSDAEAIASLRALALRLAPALSSDAADERFRVADLAGFDGAAVASEVVICNAVLHFADSDEHFDALLRGAWSALAPGGLFFARLASNIGIEARVRSIQGARCELPDGSQRYLVDEARLLAATAALGGELLDPLKTTNVQNQRCMTTWVMRRR